MTAIKTDRTDCRTCGTRLILARLPTGATIALNYARDPSGPLAVTHHATGAWSARWLTQEEMARPLLPPEWRHSKHDCGPEGDG